MEIGSRYNIRGVFDGNTRAWVHTCTRCINGKTFRWIVDEHGNILVQEEVPDGPYDTMWIIRHYIESGKA